MMCKMIIAGKSYTAALLIRLVRFISNVEKQVLSMFSTELRCFTVQLWKAIQMT